MFANISKLTQPRDYLSVLNAAIIVDIAFQVALFVGLFQSPQLARWYELFHINAAIADILILVIGVILASIFYDYVFTEWSIWNFLLLALGIQIIHDILFYALVIKPFPRGKNRMMDVFKKYADDHGAGAIFGDSLMMISTVFLSAIFKNYSLNHNIIISIFSIYLLPYVLYTKV